MEIRVGCEFVQHAAEPTHAILQVEPRPDGDFRILDSTWDEQTASASRTYVDGFGNTCRRLDMPAGHSTLRFDALVDVSPEPDEIDPGAPELQPEALPDTVVSYTLPSRFCPSDLLGDVAFDLFGGVRPGWTRAQAISDWVHDAVTFGYESASPTATAMDVLDTRAGVCRDFAHLSVALCRALNIPARYVFGYLPDIDVPGTGLPPDFCAWTEVFLGGRWWTFDPRNNTRRIGRVLIGRGRDALDVAMVSTFGPVLLESMTVWAGPPTT